MSRASLPDFVPDMLAALELSLDEAQLGRLAEYLDLLLEANQRVNLTGIRDRDACWKRNVIDSLTVLPGLSDFTHAARVIDVGSGAGLPGLPVAIARPDLQVTLLESTGKKAVFCESVVDSLSLPNVTVVQDRAETIGQQPAHRQQYDVAVCRAVGPMNVLLELTLPLVKVGGRLLAMKGPSLEGELENAGDALATLGGGELEVYDAYPVSMNMNTVIAIVEKDRPTPDAYPRLPGTPKHAPL